MILNVLHGYRMLNDWNAFVLVDESYEAQSMILMDNLYIPLIRMFLAPQL